MRPRSSHAVSGGTRESEEGMARDVLGHQPDGRGRN
jgi:hypothetical protein